MTVSTSVNKIVYPGTGAQTVFTFSFAFPGGTATQEAANFQVFYTDTLGNITLLTQGPGTTQYQITFNPATGTNPTPAGGSVTYNPSGTPIALGTFLTIIRNMPLAQGTSILNQGTLWQPVVEAGLDYEMMISQQVLEVQQRAFQVPVSDPTPAAVPAVAQRKNQGAVWDNNGNLTAGVLPASGVISSAMAPVVSAATLAAGRTAFGLGTVAVENIGAGLQDDGFGNLRVEFAPIGDSTPQSVTGTFHLTRRLLFANVTYTCPLTTTLFFGFGFWVQTVNNVATIAVNGADSFEGMSLGQSLVIGPSQTVFIQTNAGGLWTADYGNPISMTSALNLQLNASVAGSALTIAIKDRNGLDPSATSPIVIGFRDPTASGGDITPAAIVTPLSITVPNGATLGTITGFPNRIWIGLFNNGGTIVLGVYNSINFAGPSFLSWDEGSPISTTAISAGSTLSQTWYTSGSLGFKAFRILGYVESTQPTAGVWTAAPTKIQLFGPGIKKPGDTVQMVQSTTSSVSISPSNANSVIKFITSGYIPAPGAPQTTVTWKRGAGTIATQVLGSIAAGTIGVPIPLVLYDTPVTTASTTYSATSSNGTITNPIFIAEEIFT